APSCIGLRPALLFSSTGAADNLAAPAGSAGGGLAGFGAALFWALWPYSGWQFLPMAAREAREPQRNLPRAVVGGTLAHRSPLSSSRGNCARFSITDATPAQPSSLE